MTVARVLEEETATVAPATGRVALIVDAANFTPFYDAQLVAALEAEGWEIELVSSDYEFEDVGLQSGSRSRVASFRIPRSSRRRHLRPLVRALKAVAYVFDLIRLDRRLARLAPSIIHVQWAHWPWLDGTLWSRWRRAGWKVVYTAHDVPPLPGTTPQLFVRSYPALAGKADAVVVHSHAAGAALLETGAEPERIHVIQPAPPFAPGAQPLERAAARKLLGLSVDDPVILFFGFVKPYKGLPVLLRSLPLVKRRGYSPTLLIAGEVMEPVADYRSLITRLGIAAEVDWRPGFVPTSEVEAHFAAADVVVLPYLDASSSGVLLTAYSCRRPVVASAVGGLAELVVSGQTGSVVPSGDPEALADAIAELLGDPRRAAEMGELGFALTERRHTWPGMARRLDALYCELLRERPGP